jgi:phage FluMu protein Com
MSAARCAKCKGLLPAWLEAGDPANARCPNCGHVNDLSAARTPAPAPQAPPPKAPMRGTNNYAALASQGATKSPSLNKTILMGSGAAKSPEIQKAVALAKTMMMPPAPAAPPADEVKPPQKRVPTLPSLGSTEILPAPSIPVQMAPAAPEPVVKAATPAPVVKAPPPTPPPAPALGATPQHAEATDVDISVEIDTPPPAPPSQTSLPAWAVPAGNEDVETGPVYDHPVTNLLRQRSTRIGAAAVGLVALVIVVVMLTRGGKRHAPIAVEVRPPPAAPMKMPVPEPAPAPVAAEPARPAPPPPAAKTPAPRPVAARPAPEPAKPRPVAAAPAPTAPAPAPERKVMVASAKHVAAATPSAEPARRAGASSEEAQRLAKEAYARGNAQLFQGKVDEAIASFKESLKHDARNPATQRGLGLAYVQAGNAAQAVVFLKRYLKASPTASDRALIEKRIEQLSAH